MSKLPPSQRSAYDKSVIGGEQRGNKNANITYMNEEAEEANKRMNGNSVGHEVGLKHEAYRLYLCWF